MMSLTDMSLAQAARALQEKQISSVELLAAILHQADLVNPVLNVFAGLDAERAYLHAKRLDAERAQGKVRSPLHGIPMAHKDLFFRKGVPLHCSSRVPLEIPTFTADVLMRLDNAGALQFGVLNMSEFAYNPTGHNWSVGHCRNPWDPDRITGGSSSGSAASVAARANFGSLGSDTAASIRVPASICGVTGLKTTPGLVSTRGTMPLSFSLDTIGPIARSAQDCGLILEAIVETNQSDAASFFSGGDTCNSDQIIKSLRVGIPNHFFVDDVDPEISAIMNDSLEVLRDLGCQIVPVDLQGLEEANRCASLVIISEASAIHNRLMAKHKNLYSGSVLNRLEQGFSIDAPHYLEALRQRHAASMSFTESVFSKIDLLHAPVVPIRTPSIDSVAHDLDPALGDLSRQLTRFTRAINYLGLPSLALPAGYDSAQMPVAMQLIGPAFSERTLLSLGHAYQSCTDWHTRKPLRMAG